MRKLSNKELQSVSGGKAGFWWCFFASISCSNSGDALTCAGYRSNCL